MKKSKFALLLTSLLLTAAVAAGSCINNFKLSPFIKVKPLAYEDEAGYTPSQIKKAYGLDKISNTGKGQTIALIVAYGDPKLISDVSTFCSKYSLKQADITVKDMGITGSDSTWAFETALDVEWAHALAPDAKLLVYNAASDYTDDLMDAVSQASNSGAQIVSMSWGGPEDSSQIDYDSYFTHKGTIYFASSGDEGYYDDSSESKIGAEWPASSPNVIAVGGTSLKLDSYGNRLSETAWSESGGGVSDVEKEPSWQRFISSKITNNKRVTPDVSFIGDPDTGVAAYCSIQQDDGSVGWYIAGGTSLSTPALAGLVADLNQNKIVIKNASYFYTLAGGYRYSNIFCAYNDITSGENGYYAGKGYDLVTGLGSPRADKIAALKSNTTLLNRTYTRILNARYK